MLPRFAEHQTRLLQPPSTVRKWMRLGWIFTGLPKPKAEILWELWIVNKVVGLFPRPPWGEKTADFLGWSLLIPKKMIRGQFLFTLEKSKKTEQ